MDSCTMDLEDLVVSIMADLVDFITVDMVVSVDQVDISRVATPKIKRQNAEQYSR